MIPTVFAGGTNYWQKALRMGITCNSVFQEINEKSCAEEWVREVRNGQEVTIEEENNKNESSKVACDLESLWQKIFSKIADFTERQVRLCFNIHVHTTCFYTCSCMYIYGS